MAYRVRSFFIFSRHLAAHYECHPSSPRRLAPTLQSLRSYLTSSDVRGSSEPPLLEDTLGEFFLRQARTWAHNTALIVKHENLDQHGIRSCKVAQQYSAASSPVSGDKSLRWTYQALLAHAIALSQGLRDLGIKQGDRLAVCMPNNSAYAMIQWATALSGIILVTINPSYKAQEFLQALRQTGTKALVIVPSTKTSNFVEILRKILPDLQKQSDDSSGQKFFEHMILVDNVSGRRRTTDFFEFSDALKAIPGSIDYQSLLAFDRCNEFDISTALVRKDDLVNLQFTSGTTALPKAVALTHHNLLNNGYFIGRAMKLSTNDVLANVPPLFHCFGLVLGNLAAWTHGSSVVYPAEGFDPVKTLEACHEERCTALHGVPTMFIAELAALQRHRAERCDPQWDLSALRTGIAAGSPVPTSLMAKIMASDKDEQSPGLNLRELTIAYGMTETSPVTFQSYTDDQIEKRINTIGRIQPHIRARIVDPDCTVWPPTQQSYMQQNDPKDQNIVDHSLLHSLIHETAAEPLPIGTKGEVWVSGYPLARGYWGDIKQTLKVLVKDPDGTHWLRTGDQGCFDEEGYLTITGRIKDLIIRGGENLSSVAIENCISHLDGVADVSVVALKDPVYGESPCAWVMRAKGAKGKDLTPQIIQSAVKEKMSGANEPTRVWFLGEDECAIRGYNDIPKTASGKHQKHTLRAWAQDMNQDVATNEKY